MTHHSNPTQQQNNDAFLDACSTGNLSLVKQLLASNPFIIHAKDKYGIKHALSNACGQGHMDIVTYLLTSPELSEHANIHTNHDNALGAACYYGHLNIVKYLLTSPELAEHANIHANENIQALAYACQSGHLDVVRYLLTSPELQEHSDIHANKDRALMVACTNGHLEIIKYLLTSCELTEHAHDNHILKTAFEHTHAHVVNFLLYDMRISVQEETYENMVHPAYSHQLKHLVAKRDMFFKINEKMPEDTTAMPSVKPKI